MFSPSVISLAAATLWLATAPAHKATPTPDPEISQNEAFCIALAEKGHYKQKLSMREKALVVVGCLGAMDAMGMQAVPTGPGQGQQGQNQQDQEDQPSDNGDGEDPTPPHPHPMHLKLPPTEQHL